MGRESGVANLVGRDAELAEIEALLDGGRSGPQLLLLEGEAGIGKTSLWRAGVERALTRGFRVLSTRPAEAEAKLSFAALGDLAADVTDQIGALPDPQRRALRVALLLEEPTGSPPGTREIGVAVLALLRRIAGEEPVLLAIDDVQWLDAPSASVLAFALRRLADERIVLLTAARPGGGLPIEATLRLVVGPLDSHALSRVIREAVSQPPPPRLRRRIDELSAGNPFLALELARAVARSATPTEATKLSLPRDLRTLARERLRSLPVETRRALTVAAALAQPTRSLVERALAPHEAGLAAAVEAGVAEIEADEIRFAHPLLASVLYSDAEPKVRRRLHGTLAGLVPDGEERARHLALATDPPDAAVAAALEQAAQQAYERGAIDSATDLGERALVFTPRGSVDDEQRRMLANVGFLARGGSKAQARELVGAAYAGVNAGPERARVVVTATSLGLWSAARSIERLRSAIDEAAGDTGLLADLHCDLAHKLLYSPDLRGAAEHSEAAVELAERLTDDARLVSALVEAAWVDLFSGNGLDVERLDRAVALEARVASPFGNVAVASGFYGFALGAIDELDSARSMLDATVDEIRKRGDTGVTWSLQELARVEMRAGNWQRARTLAEESLEISRDVDDPLQGLLATLRLLRLGALRGETDDVRRQAAEALGLADAAESPLSRADIQSTLGFVELSLGDAALAVAQLDEAARFVTAMGLEEPGILPFVPDHVEALVAVGDLDRAESATSELEKRGRRLGRKSAIAGSARCHGLIASSRGDLGTALARLDEACQVALPAEPFERARTLLVGGGIRRRARRISEARESITEALGIFERLGAAVWAEKARAELMRLGGRPSRPGALTATEYEIADLVARGRSNHEVAQALHLSPKTVEWNLSKIYKKLRVRSRTELAAKLGRRSANG